MFQKLKRTKEVANFFELLGNHQHHIKNAKIIGDQLIQITQSKPNYKQNISQSYSSLYDLNSLKKISEQPISTQEQVSKISPDQKYKVAILQVPHEKPGEKPKNVLQIFKNGDQLIKQINYDDIHGKIEDNSTIGLPFQWNHDSTKFLYIANQTQKKGKYVLDLELKKESDLEEFSQFNKYSNDYGEQMVDIREPKLFEYDVLSQVLRQIQLPEKILPAHPVYLTLNGKESIIVQGYTMYDEFKYGIIHCYNRESKIYHLTNYDQESKQLHPKPDEKKENEEEKEEKKINVQYKVLSKEFVCVRPVVSPDMKYIAYLSAPKVGTHLTYMDIKLIDTSDFSIQNLNDFSREYQRGQFMGFVGFYNMPGTFQWLKDSQNLIFGTVQEASDKIYLLNIKNKIVHKLTEDKTKCEHSAILSYDIVRNSLLYLNQTNQHPSVLKIVDFNQFEQESFENQEQFQKILQQSTKTIDVYQENQENFVTKISNFLKENIQEEILELKDGNKDNENVQAPFWSLKQKLSNIDQLPKEILDLCPFLTQKEEQQQNLQNRSLLIHVHGGPHGYTFGYFSAFRIYCLLNGYSILAPNFTGSAGYGQNFIENLQTKVGEVDRLQIVDFVNIVVEEKKCHPKNIISWGGSYGGQMGAYLAGKNSDLIKCAVLLNPVTNMAFSTSITDIPEWNLNVTFGKDEMNWNLKPEDYTQLFEKSPMNFPAKVPILLLLGQVDRRVPYEQGLAYRAQTIANNIPIQTYVYPKSNHNLADSLQTEFELNVKTAIYMEENINQ